MSLTLWTNHTLRPGARAMFTEGLAAAGCRLVQSAICSRSVLAQGEPDPALAEADLAYGQPGPGDVIKNPRWKWVALSTAGYTRYDRDDFRAAMKQRGTLVTNVSAVFSNPCAEHLLGQMLAFTRGPTTYILNQAGPRESDYPAPRYSTSLLAGYTWVPLGDGALRQTGHED